MLRRFAQAPHTRSAPVACDLALCVPWLLSCGAGAEMKQRQHRVKQAVLSNPEWMLVIFFSNFFGFLFWLLALVFFLFVFVRVCVCLMCFVSPQLSLLQHKRQIDCMTGFSQIPVMKDEKMGLPANAGSAWQDASPSGCAASWLVSCSLMPPRSYSWVAHLAETAME